MGTRPTIMELFAGVLRLLFASLLPFLVNSSLTLTPEGYGCCGQVTVQDAIGVYAELNGIYILIENPTAELKPECVDGCIYRLLDDPEDDEYCFREESFSATGAAIKTDSCPAITTASLTPSASTASTAPTAPTASTTGSTTAAPALNLKEETDSQISQLSALIKDDGTSESLKTELGGVLDLLSSLSSSLGGFRSRMKRAISDLTCNDLVILIGKYNEVINLVELIIAALNSIGSDTGSQAVDNFIKYSLSVFVAAKPELEDNRKEYEDASDQKSCLSTTSTTVAVTSV